MSNPVRPAATRQLGLALGLAFHRQNWLLWLGATLVIGAASLQWVARPWLAQQNRTATRAIQASLAQRADAGLHPRADGPRERASQRAQAFAEMLGDERRFEQHLGDLFGYAKDAGLTLAQANYDHATDANGGFTLDGVGLPLKGNYGALRTFSETILLRMPFVSLDSIQLKRSSISADAVEAKLHLTFYQRGTISSGTTPASVVAPPMELP
ncbi:hypothetical protein [Cupriavidus pauculus]|uniref:hypothetical protein n=1 Tax=Cupriavidus pauculus TaxID=82633 RepID=UPI001EE1F8C6|nr:hypothetical protein [Cupriavidus pauculus]GJG96670.1 hypothetical protein CBA19C6_19295 [Cupriavidus pauculus]